MDPQDLDQETIHLEINVKSVNSRYLDTRIHIPKEYAKFEIEIKKHVAKSFRRGTVDIYVNRRKGEAFDQFEIVTRKSLAKKWHKAYKDLHKELKDGV